DCMLTGHKVLGLQLFASTRSKTQAKVRQSIIPWTGDAHLLCTVLGRKFSNGVKIFGCALRLKKVRGSLKPLAAVNAAFDPDLVESLFLPVGKQADAVAAGFDSVKVVFQLTQREIFIHMLLHHKSGLNIKSDLGDYTQCTYPNHGSSK